MWAGGYDDTNEVGEEQTGFSGSTRLGCCKGKVTKERSLFDSLGFSLCEVVPG